MFTLISTVRQLSGFPNELKVRDSIIIGKIQKAQSIVVSAIGKKYALPLPYHRSRSIEFKGVGTGAATMTITINGSDYTVAVTVGMTASEAADLFRVAADSSADFVTNTEGNDEIVLIISNTDSSDLSTANDEVNVTANAAAGGIEVLVSTRVDRYPQILDQITADIATAYILLDNYGVDAQDTPKDGNVRLEMAKEMLAMLQGGKGLNMNIYDEITGVELSSSSVDIPSFYPNNTSDEDVDDPTSAKLGINDIW